MKSLAVIAGWYAKNLPSEQAEARYEKSYHRNRRRLTNRLDPASVDTAAIDKLDALAVLLRPTPFDPVRWLAERRLRQQDTLQTLARLSAEQAGSAERIAPQAPAQEGAGASAAAVPRACISRSTCGPATCTVAPR